MAESGRYLVLVNGKPERHHEGSYCLEWREKGKRIRLSVGKDAQDAAARRQRQEAELHALNTPCILYITKYFAERNTFLWRVCDFAAQLDKAVEIDAYPDRQDLSPDLVKLAKRSGCRISLGTDSHDPMQLRFMEYALASAVKAGGPRERMLNFMDADELRSWAASVRDRFNRAA